MEWLTADLAIAFVTLLLLEVVLGIDNVVFISILADKLPEEQRARARTIGLLLAFVTRVILLFSLSWVIGLTSTLFTVLDNDISGRDLILVIGGLFLIGKATLEIRAKLEGEDDHGSSKVKATFGAVIAQIVVLDIVFSLDSVITAVGMVDELWVMIAAVMIAIAIMLVSAGAISNFVSRHPTVKMLALSFLILIGASLVAEGFDQHIPKGYVYGPIAFSILVELLNLRVKAMDARRKARRAGAEVQAVEVEPVHLRQRYVGDTVAATSSPGAASGSSDRSAGTGDPRRSGDPRRRAAGSGGSGGSSPSGKGGTGPGSGRGKPPRR